MRCKARRYGYCANPVCPGGFGGGSVPRAESLTPSPDNHMINGTKLLNVAGMTRGRRDGILKSEKMRHVVKIGPMHLKGVWYETRRKPWHSSITGANSVIGFLSSGPWTSRTRKK